MIKVREFGQSSGYVEMEGNPSWVEYDFVAHTISLRSACPLDAEGWNTLQKMIAVAQRQAGMKLDNQDSVS